MHGTYSIDPQIFEVLPGFRRVVLICRSGDNSASHVPELQEKLKKEVSTIISDNTISLEHHSVKVWRDAYRSFPKQKKFRPLPSFAALIQRIRRGKGAQIPFISPAVCITNIIALRHLVPSGLFDYSMINGDILLTSAKGLERFHPFGVMEEIRPQPGEIALIDSLDQSVICGCFNSRGDRHHMVTHSSSKIIVDVDIHPDVRAAKYIDVIAHETCELLKTYCCSNVRRYVLDAQTTCVSLNYETSQTPIHGLQQ